jgi:hypothetical protein
MIVAAPQILRRMNDHSRQEDAGFGGRIDLLAIAPDGGLVLIKPKRGRTPHDVIVLAVSDPDHSWQMVTDRGREDRIAAINGIFDVPHDMERGRPVGVCLVTPASHSGRMSSHQAGDRPAPSIRLCVPGAEWPRAASPSPR